MIELALGCRYAVQTTTHFEETLAVALLQVPQAGPRRQRVPCGRLCSREDDTAAARCLFCAIVERLLHS